MMFVYNKGLCVAWEHQVDQVDGEQHARGRASRSCWRNCVYLDSERRVRSEESNDTAQCGAINAGRRQGEKNQRPSLETRRWFVLRKHQHKIPGEK